MARSRTAAITLLAAGALLLAVLASSGGAAARRPVRVAVFITSGNLRLRLARQRDLVFRPGAPGGTDDVTVDPAVRYQTLTAGFGVAMTDTSAYLLRNALGPRLRARVMRQLFSRTSGIGLSFLRVPIGGSDYVVHNPYTYDDMPSGKADPTLSHFSLAHDRPYIIPEIRQALAVNPALTLMTNPWTPPAWMKTDDQLITRTGPAGTLIPGYYGVYAKYLLRFLQGYRAAGIPVRYLGVQNEPLTPLLLVSGIPESYLSPQDEGRLIHDYVAPALHQAHLRTKIVAYDDGFQRSEGYVPVVMQTAGGDVAGLAYHCYLSDPSSMSTEHQLYPTKPALETECSSELSNIEPSQMAIRSLRNWAQGIQLWNAALDTKLGPKIGSGCMGVTPPHLGKQCIAPVIIDIAKHRYSLTSDYWELAQFSKFIHLGARRIQSTTPSSCPTSPTSGYNCGLEDVAFRNRDGSEVLVATSHDGQAHTLTVTEHGHSFSYRVPDGATVTFVWRAR